MRPSCAAESLSVCHRGYSKYDTLSNPARRRYAASASRFERLPPKPCRRMTGSLDGSQKYGSPRLTSQSNGYEPISAPAAAISVMTVLEFTISPLLEGNHAVSVRQPLPRVFANAPPTGAQCQPRRPHHQFRATAPNRG